MKNKIIVFDLDDTLISEKDYIDSGFRNVSNIFAQRYNLSSEDVYSTMKNLFQEDTNKIFNRLFENYKIFYDDIDIRKLVKLYREHTPNINLLEDARLVLESLRRNNIKIGIITDGYKETQNKKIEVLNLENIVEKIIVTDELGKEYWKPDKRSFEMMKKYFGVEYSEMIYVGDNLKKDFLAPNELGMLSIQIERKEGIYSNIHIQEKKYLPKLKIKNLVELLKILKLEEEDV